MAQLVLSLIISVLLMADLKAAENPAAGKTTNRLAGEASPYLRQHATNPIDWYPWGEEAFKKARAEHKPIFLSIGYSTCHWCHVMADESFVDQQVADYLNKHFVAIKVDRESHPDVDETYMIATEIMTQRGGWPNSVFLAPDLKPFYAATYMPKDVFLQALQAIALEWVTNNPALTKQGEEIARVINAVMTRRVEARSITAELLEAAAHKVVEPLDEFFGGFTTAPKFPQEALLLFLAERALHRDDDKAKNALEISLEGMLNGGIHDHVGGGFHRYAVDNRWLVPHFEKMLYNQALLSLVLIRAHKLTSDPRYERALRQALDFVLHEMTGPGGRFYTAFDADSKAPDGTSHEGTFYVWTQKSLREALGKEDADFAAKVFGVTTEGNFENGTSVLHFPKNPYAIAHELKRTEAEFFQILENIKKRLAEFRKKRAAPGRDEKTITSWNALMISAFAEAAAHLADERYKQAAITAAQFNWTKMGGADGKLTRIFFENETFHQADQEDYANLARAYIAVFDLTQDRTWLDRASDLADQMVALFHDAEAGDYFRTASIGTFTRGKTRNDSSIPSGNAVALEVFAKLMHRSQDPKHRQRGEELLNAISGVALGEPTSNAYALMAADLFLNNHTGGDLYLAKGTVRANAEYLADSKRIVLTLDIAPGWHINANKVLDEYQIPTEVKLTGAKPSDQISYPQPIRRKLGFRDAELNLYEGSTVISLPLKSMPEEGVAKAELTLQACSNDICLEPETAVLTIRKGR